MTDEEFEEFKAYARELADKSGYAWGIKGIPRTDKHLEELDVARRVLDHLAGC